MASVGASSRDAAPYSHKHGARRCAPAYMKKVRMRGVQTLCMQKSKIREKKKWRVRRARTQLQFSPFFARIAKRKDYLLCLHITGFSAINCTSKEKGPNCFQAMGRKLPYLIAQFRLAKKKKNRAFKYPPATSSSAMSQYYGESGWLGWLAGCMARGCNFPRPCVRERQINISKKRQAGQGRSGVR